MNVPDEYYIVMPAGSFATLDSKLKAKGGDEISEALREEIDQFLVDNGTFTDQNQFTRNKQRDFRYWHMEGTDRVIVEKHE